MNGKSLLIGIALGAIIAGGLAVAVVPGGAGGSGIAQMNDPDKREILRLPPDERDLVLTEMRNFVIALQSIADGLAKNDMARVSNAARMMGSGAANEIPPHVVAKLPDPFKQLAGKVHTTFDAISLDAELGDIEHSLGQVGTLMQHCVACHGIYQIRDEVPN